MISSSSFSSSLPITFIIALAPLRHHPHPRWGSNCTETCSCSKGTTCHHVTGECLPCAPGIWGEGCKQECRWENLSLHCSVLLVHHCLFQDDLWLWLRLFSSWSFFVPAVTRRAQSCAATQTVGASAKETGLSLDLNCSGHQLSICPDLV